MMRSSVTSDTVVLAQPLPVGTTSHAFDPIPIIQVPLYRLTNATCKSLLGSPAEVPLDLARIDRVASVVPGPVLHEGDQIGVRLAVCPGSQLIEDHAHALHHVEIRLLVPAADVVDLADLARFQHAHDRAAVVLDVKPVTHLLAVAIYRKRLTGERVQDHQRNQLLWKVVRSVVVAAVGRDDRQSVSMVPRANQVIAGRFARRVWRVRLVGTGLGKGRIRGGQRAVDLISRDVHETKVLLAIARQLRPISANRLEQIERAHDIGLDEIAGTMNRPIHVRFRGEVDDRARVVLREHPAYQLAIADVALYEHMAGIVLQRSQVRQVTGVGELVEIDDMLVRLSEPGMDKIAADKTGAASN